MVQITKQLQRQSITPWFTQPGPEHVAQFYQNEVQQAVCALEYIYNGLVRRETCIVIATPQKLIALQKGLRRRGVDIATAMSLGWYVPYDAEELIAAFMDEREIDDADFKHLVGGLVSQAINTGRKVRVFGEMAALLRQQHNRNAVLRLEEKMNELLEEHAFSLYCAYPHAAADQYQEMRPSIVAAHSYTFDC